MSTEDFPSIMPAPLTALHDVTFGSMPRTGSSTGMGDTHAPDTLAAYTGERADVIAMISGTPRRVLDIGCSDGSLAVSFRRRGAETWGIEIDAAFAERAQGRLDHVLLGDGLQLATRLAADGERFDVVICADSLEHMVDPWGVLKQVRRLLTDDGVVVVSLPNVPFYTTIVWLVIRGRWPYLTQGVHDRTHLRWFTDRDARDMFAEAGFDVDATFTHYRFGGGRAGLRRGAHRLAIGPLRPFLAYQYLYRLRPSQRGEGASTSG